MRSFILIPLILCYSGFCMLSFRAKEGSIPGQQEIVGVIPKEFPIEIIVTQTASYCGGVKPRAEFIKQLETPRPLEGKKIFVKQGDKNTFNAKVIIEAVSDSAGKIQFMLPSGKYFIVEEKKKDRGYYDTLLEKYLTPTTEFSAIDTSCLKAWYELPDLIFEIKSDESNNLKLNFHRKCSYNEIPCIQFRGHLPQ